MRHARWLFVMLLAACGGGATGGDGEDDSSGGEGDTAWIDEAAGGGGDGADGDPSDRAPGECPARYGQTGPTCDGTDDPVGCSYPEGTCSCASPTWCGGAAPPEMPYEWTCEAPRPSCAAAGDACTQEGETCSTDRCGWSGVRCTGGTWSPYHHAPPP